MPVLENSSVNGCHGGESSLWYQDSTGYITGIGLTGTKDAERWTSPFSVNGGTRALKLTHIVCGVFPPTNLSAAVDWHLYFQTNGTNIVDYSRSPDGWSWRTDLVPMI